MWAGPRVGGLRENLGVGGGGLDRTWAELGWAEGWGVKREFGPGLGVGG